MKPIDSIPFFISVETPIGDFRIGAADEKIVSAFWDDLFPPLFFNSFDGKESSVLQKAKKQVEAYFDGTLREFDLPYFFNVSPFLTQVYQNCLAVPYGTLASYQDLAPHAPRAAGYAMRTNPLPLFVPCHRIVPKNGGIGNYMGKHGVDKKRFLLRHEGLTIAEKEG